MAVKVSSDHAFAVIVIDNPTVNATSRAFRAGLIEALTAANTRSQTQAVILAWAGHTSGSGVEVAKVDAPPETPSLTDVTLAVERSDKPVVAALNGTVVGVGLEIALAAHGRVASGDASFGLPEVTLGVMPGAGGTQRLPRLVGMEKALELITSGRQFSADEGAAIGLVDVVSHGDLLTDAKALAQALMGKPPRRTGLLPIPSFDSTAVESQLRFIERKARGQISPTKAAWMVRRAAELDLNEGLIEERAAFLELAGSPQAAALRHVVAAERESANVPGLKAAGPIEIGTIGVAGVGLMGAGIAVSCLDAGFRVRGIEHDEAAAECGRRRIEAIYTRLRKSGRITEEAETQRLARIEILADRSAFADCDMVIEAIFDDLTTKQELFRSLSGIVRADTILATNTSYLDPERIAAAIDNPARFLGLHFFSPANVMRLVEVVRMAATSNDVLFSALGFVKRLGKLGVVSGVCEGFMGNRIFSAYREACDFMLEEGALPQEIDSAMEAFGFSMGLYAVSDMAGLDISWARRKRQAATRDPVKPYSVIADRLCEAGRLGRKTGKGYYRYDDGGRSVDPEVTEIIETASRQAGIKRRAITADEICSRVQGGILATGRQLIEEGITQRASDIDVVMIHGYGYPAWRGGPMYEAGLSRR